MRIGMVGYKFMGKAHSHAYRTAPYFFDIQDEVELAAVCGRNEAAVADFARQQGWQSYETDWRKLVERDDIDAIDIGTPNDSHYEIAVAAAGAGKHILLEKPMVTTTADAEALIAAAQEIGFKVPVVVRLEGTNVDRARELLKEASIDALIPADDLTDAAKKVCAQVA